MKKVNRLYERVVEAEARDGAQEREVKSSLERVMHAMQTEIKSLKESQESLIKKLLQEKKPEIIVEHNIPTSPKH